MTSYWIFIIFLTLIGLPNTIFAEPTDVEIDWIVEGQIASIKSDIQKFDDEKMIENNPIIEEQIDVFQFKQNNIYDHITEDFITDGGFVINGREITIDSNEGQILNQMLIEQKKINQDNFFHIIKYLDRYSDGYVELAEALIDPLKKQNYQSSGISTDYYINSNLENFLVERGYDLDDLKSIPNNAFSPTKYDDVRLKASMMSNDGLENVDLRELLPNYIRPDSQVMKDDMIRKLSEQTTRVYETISSKQLEISVTQSPTFSNKITSDLFNNFQFIDTKFENTQHVIDSLEKPNTIFEFSNSIDYNLLILIPIIMGLILSGYLIHRRSFVKFTLPMITVSPSIDYVENTLEIIQSSKILFENNLPKPAFEKFSQAIRYYYSQKLHLNLDLTYIEIMQELKKSNIPNVVEIDRWLQLCSQVEFVRHESTQKEFVNYLNTFKKSIS